MLMINVHIDIGPGRTTVKNKNPPVQKSRKTKETAPVGHAFCEMECFYVILDASVLFCSASRRCSRKRSASLLPVSPM